MTLSGDHQAKLMAEYEPMKLASAEALWDTDDAAGFSLFAVGDSEISSAGGEARSGATSWTSRSPTS